VHIEDYVVRIANATPVQLVVINHELLVGFIDQGLAALEAEELEPFELAINKAKNALQQLIEGLDYETEIAQELYDLYLYAGEQLNKAFFGRDAEPARVVRQMFELLLEGWRTIEDTPDDRAQEPEIQVYAGLTYEKDGLSEYVDQDESRGFKA